MGKRLAIPAVCAALAALAGCGSSGSSSSNGSSTASSPTAATQATTNKGSLKVTTTPKFAPATGPVRSGTVRIAYRNIAIAPDTVRVKLGSTIRWTNFDQVVHNVTSEGGPERFASKDFGEGTTFKIKANRPGVIHYECTLHPASMNGTIEVVS
jgi:plastocyanin